MLILLLRYAFAEAEADAEASPEADADADADASPDPEAAPVPDASAEADALQRRVKKPLKIANPKLIHTSHVIQNQKGSFQVWLVKGQAKEAERKPLKGIPKAPVTDEQGKYDHLARFRQTNIPEAGRSGDISNDLDSFSAPSEPIQHHQLGTVFSPTSQAGGKYQT